MGQKSNVLTLRKKNSFSLLNLQPKNILYINTFLQNLKFLFFQKKTFLVRSALNLMGNQVSLTLYLFFRTVKINNLKRKFILCKTKKHATILKAIILSKLYAKILSQLQTNLIVLSVVNLNQHYDKSTFSKLFLKFKHFHATLFPRRFNFFIDFLKITILFLLSKIELKFYIEILGQIFKILPKRRHNFFLSFMEQFFSILIKETLILNNANLKGIKFMLSGRIQAKPRAKFRYFQVGTIPMQSITKNIEFSKLHIFTVYGVFGLKIWTYKK